jgi:hypothetical protein
LSKHERFWWSSQGITDRRETLCKPQAGLLPAKRFKYPITVQMSARPIPAGNNLLKPSFVGAFNDQAIDQTARQRKSSGAK